MRHAALISNPIAGRRQAARRVHQLADIFTGHGWQVELMETAGPGGAEERAREAVGKGLDAVLALGGDGTLRECAAGVLGSQTALGFLPCGTTNVMSLAFGLPTDAFRAAHLLAVGGATRMDVGICGSTPFLMQASAGIDAAVIAALNPRTKRFLGQAAVAPAALRVLASYRFPRFEIVVDGRRREATFAAICNIPFYGGPWQMTPARIDDGRLHAALFSGRGRGATLGFAFDLLRGRHLQRPDVEILSLEEVEIPAASGLELQMDGDAFPGRLPARVRVGPAALRVLVPAAS